MKSTLVTFALAMTAAEAQWTENVYGRRTSATNKGSWGPSDTQRTTTNNSFSNQSGNYNDWSSSRGQGGWGRMYGASAVQQEPVVPKPIVMTAPEIKYEKIPLPYGPVAAAAEMNKDSMRGLIVMGQKNNENVKVDIRLAGLTAETEYELRI